jgi:hypothetical protein
VVKDQNRSSVRVPDILQLMVQVFAIWSERRLTLSQPANHSQQKIQQWQKQNEYRQCEWNQGG